MKRKKLLILLGMLLLLVLVVAMLPACAAAPAEVVPIKLGCTGPMSGPAASWGLVGKRCNEMFVTEINAEGGLLVSGVKHPIVMYTEDTRFEAPFAKTAAERLVYEHKVKYVIGGVGTMGTRVMEPIFEPAKVVFFTASFTKELYGPAHPYTIATIPPTFITAPIVLKHLIESEDAKTLYCLGSHDPSGHVVAQAIEAGTKLGLEVLTGAEEDTFELDIIDFHPVATRVIAANPDILAIACGAEHQAAIVKACGELGFKGRIVAVLAGDIETMVSVAGEYAEGVLWTGGSPDPTPKMIKFMEDYEARFGVWNDEATMKIVLPWMWAATLQEAGEAAITDTDAFLAAMPNVAWPDLYVEGNPLIKYIGEAEFGSNCLVGVPVCITEVQNGKCVVIRTVIPE